MQQASRWAAGPSCCPSIDHIPAFHHLLKWLFQLLISKTKALVFAATLYIQTNSNLTDQISSTHYQYDQAQPFWLLFPTSFAWTCLFLLTDYCNALLKGPPACAIEPVQADQKQTNLCISSALTSHHFWRLMQNINHFCRLCFKFRWLLSCLCLFVLYFP